MSEMYRARVEVARQFEEGAKSLSQALFRGCGRVAPYLAQPLWEQLTTQLGEDPEEWARSVEPAEVLRVLRGEQ